jgi:glycosyltransferase involved in cell wall biosynthesis
MKILIVSVFFPPKNSIASQRAYSWAKHFARLGHDVTVLTTEKVDQSQPPISDHAEPGFNLIEVAVPLMKPLSGFLGKPQGHTPRQEATIQRGMLEKFKDWLVNCARRLQQTYGIMYACRMPEIHDLWVIPAYRQVSGGSWDVVITTAWPYSVHFVGWMLKRNHHARLWVVDWRDLWTANHIYPGVPLIKNLEKWLEKRFNTYADMITTVSNPLAKYLAERYGNKVHVINNGYDEDDYNALPGMRIFPDDGKIRVVYTGSLYPGKRDPSPLFQAIARLTEQSLISPNDLEVIFASKLLDVAELATASGVLPYVKCLGFLPREEALRMQRDADALLFLEHEAPGVEGILTGKLFEYLYAGPPILAIGISKESDAGNLIHASGRGCALGNDVSNITEWLRYLIVNKSPPPMPIQRMGIHVYSRVYQATKLLGLISAELPRQAP